MDRYVTLLLVFCCVEPNYIAVANYKSDLEMVSSGTQQDKQIMIVGSTRYRHSTKA